MREYGYICIYIYQLICIYVYKRYICVNKNMFAFLKDTVAG